MFPYFKSAGLCRSARTSWSLSGTVRSIFASEPSLASDSSVRDAQTRHERICVTLDLDDLGGLSYLDNLGGDDVFGKHVNRS